MTSAEAVKGAFVGTVQVVTQFNQVVGASGQVLDSMRDIGVDAMSQLANAVQHVEEEWKKFTDGVGSFKPNLGLGGDTAGGGKGKGSGDQIASFGGFSGSPQDMLQQFQNLFGSLTPQPFVNGIFSDMQQFLIGFERTALRTALANYYALHQSDAVHYDEYGATSTQGGSSKGPGPAPVDPLAGMVPIPGAPGHYQTPPAQDGVTMGLQSLSGAIQNLNTDASKGGAAMVDLGTAMQGSAYLLPKLSDSIIGLGATFSQAADAINAAMSDTLQSTGALEQINAMPGLMQTALDWWQPSNGDAYNSVNQTVSSISSKNQLTISGGIHVNSRSEADIAEAIINKLQRTVGR